MKCTIKYNSIFPVLVKVWNWTTCLAPSLPVPNAWSSPRYAPCDASPTSTPSPTSFSHLKVPYSLIVCMSFWGDLAFCSLFFSSLSPVLHCQTSQSTGSFWCLDGILFMVTEQRFGFVQAMCQTSQPMNSQCLDGISHSDRAKLWVYAGNVSDSTANEQSVLRWHCTQWQTKALGLCRQCVRLHSQWTVSASMASHTGTEQSFGFVQAMCQTSQPMNSQFMDGIVHNDGPKFWVCAGNVSDFTANEQSIHGWHCTQWRTKVLGLCRQCVGLCSPWAAASVPHPDHRRLPHHRRHGRQVWWESGLHQQEAPVESLLFGQVSPAHTWERGRDRQREMLGFVCLCLLFFNFVFWFFCFAFVVIVFVFLITFLCVCVFKYKIMCLSLSFYVKLKEK